jgi:hypothetical protein
MEELKNIDESYAVSKDGRVWSYKTNRWLKPAVMGSGYLSVSNGIRKSSNRRQD